MAEDGAAHDRFGLVAIDGNTVLVGAPRNRYTALNSSAVYVFAKVQGSWTQQTRVPASIGLAADGYGAPSIAGSTFIIGAGVDRNNGPRSGSAFVFSVIDAEFDGVADRVDNCPAAFNPDQSDTNGDGYGDACVDPSVLVSEDMDLDRTVRVGAFAELKKDVRVGAYSIVGSEVDLNRGVSVGNDVAIGDGAVLKKDIQVGNAASIGPGVRIGKGAFVGSGAVIGANTVIGNETVICAAAEIGANSRIGKKNLVSTLAVVSPQSVHDGNRGPAPDPADCGATMQSAVDTIRP